MLYQFGPYSLDTALPLLLRDGKTVAVSARALNALVHLVEKRETAVTKQELMDTLWIDAFVEEGSLTQLISVLRKTFAADFPLASPIQTIPKLGYRFVAEVTSPAASGGDVQIVEHTTEEAKAESSPMVTSANPDTVAVVEPLPDPSAPAQDTRNFYPNPGFRLIWLVPLVVVAVSTAAFLLTRRAPTLRAHAATPRSAIAVLPFRNLAQSSQSAWVGTAVQEMLATDLRLHQGFRVLPSEDVARALKETNLQLSNLDGSTLHRLGDDLDCAHAITGAYLLQNGQLRLDVRLVNLDTGVMESEATFQQAEATLLPMLATVQQKIAHDLGVAPEAGDVSLAQVSPGLSPEAGRLYSEGSTLVRDYDGQAATEVLDRLVALDPSFPLAHLQLSFAWSERGDDLRSAAEALRAEHLASKLTREQQLIIHARAQSANHQFAAAAETYRLLFRSFPDDPAYGRLLVQNLSDAGESDQAVEEVRSLLATFKDRSPDPMTDSIVADLYSMRGNWSEALKWSEAGLAESQRRGALLLYERLLTTASQANLYLKRYAAAEVQTRQALDLATRFDDASGLLRALNRLGQIGTAQGNLPAAESSLLAALAMERKFDQRQRQLHTLLNLSRLNEKRGDLRAASAYASQAKLLADALGRVEMQTEVQLQQAMLLGHGGGHAQALQQLLEAHETAVRIHDEFLQKASESAAKLLQEKQ